MAQHALTTAVPSASLIPAEAPDGPLGRDEQEWRLSIMSRSARWVGRITLEVAVSLSLVLVSFGAAVWMVRH